MLTKTQLTAFILIFLLYLIGVSVFIFRQLLPNKSVNQKSNPVSKNIIKLLDPIASPSPQIVLTTPPLQKILPTNYHVFQTFNNCGPASLSMALAIYGINVSQQQLGQELRPYQNPQGDNDDKSVTLEELGEKARDYGFVPYHRPNGNFEIIKKFITYDLPVITRTTTKPNEDIGHYRVVKGYDQLTGEIIQDDSLQNKNLRFTEADFNLMWQKFNYEYLVLVPQENVEIVNAILGDEADAKIAWTHAVANARNQLQHNPNDINARFNLSVALYNVGDFQGSVTEFEKVENLLPFRTLWYQIEPIQAYYELGNYARVFTITDKILNTYNRAFSELYLIRGEIYRNQGDLEAARAEFEKAVFYNQALESAQDALNSLN